ncbi:MAG: HAD-IA family hydrolase [Paludibacteraceae bacterium]|nr:HAD-IA family hydrolase [Paludibacteraceae bacterium]
MKYKAIFLDIDDTLLDYVPCCKEAFDRSMEELKKLNIRRLGSDEETNLFQIFFDIAERLFSEAKHGKYTIAEVMDLYPREFCERVGYPSEAVEPFTKAFRRAWGDTHVLVSGAMEVVVTLHARGYRLFAASNSFGHLQRNRLQRAGLLAYLEDTYISMDIGYDKPDIRFFQEALHRCGLQPSEVLMVGDSMTTDILGAQAVGMDTCFLDRREGKGDIGSLSQLLDRFSL